MKFSEEDGPPLPPLRNLHWLIPCFSCFILLIQSVLDMVLSYANASYRVCVFFCVCQCVQMCVCVQMCMCALDIVLCYANAFYFLVASLTL